MTRTLRLGASLWISIFGSVSMFALSPSCPVGYAQPRSYDRGTALRVAVEVADFDVDGLPDIASLHRAGDDGTPNRVGTILLNRGNEAFDSKPILAAGDFATLRAGRLNGDNFPDLVLGGPGPLTILHGNGDGTFRQAAALNIRNVTSIAIGQFDGRNGNDIAVTQSAPATFTLVVSNADGSYSIGTSVGLNDRGVAIAAADFDADGKTDLAVADGTAVTPYYSNGDGTFTKGSPITNIPPVSLALGDVDRDGRIDIVIGGKNSVSVFVNAGARSFRLNGISSLNGDANSTTLTDLNHDANPDVVVAGTDDVAVFLGTAGGRFGPPILYGAGADPEFASAADFNGDGFVDVVVANLGSTDISILRNNRDGTLDAMRELQSKEGAIALAVADVDEQKPDDLIIASNLTDEVRMFRPTGAWFEALSGNQLGFTPKMLRLGDVNGDLRPDLGLLSADNKTIGILPSVMGGTFSAPTLISNGIELCCFAFTDLNRDGRDDLVYANLTGTLTVRFSTGGTTFSSATNYTLPDPAKAIAVGDFDQDGNNDVAVATAVQLFIFNGLPNGELSLGTILDIVGIKMLEAGRVTDDIFPDLVAAGSDVTVFENHHGTFESQVHLTLPTEEPTGITIADLNADERNDIAVTSTGIGATFNYVTIYTQRSDFGFDTQPAIETDARPAAIVAHDFDEDGIPELAIAAAGKTYISHWRCATPAVTVGVPRGIVPGQPAAFVANIVNGTAEGATYTFFVDGKVVAAVASNPNEPGIARANLTFTPGPHIVSVTVVYKENTSASSSPISVNAGAGKRHSVRH